MTDTEQGFSDEQVARLKAHAERATTTVRWKTDGHNHLEPGCRCFSCHLPTSTFGLNVMIFCDEQPTGESDCSNQGFRLEDVEYLVEAQPENILALLARLSAAEEELARARTALREANRP